MPIRPSPSIVSAEVARFEALGDTWWDPEGPMAPLHRINPVRIGWARDLIARHFKLETGVGAPLASVAGRLRYRYNLTTFAGRVARLDPNFGYAEVDHHLGKLAIGDQRDSPQRALERVAICH